MDDEVRLYVLAEFDSRTEERLSNYRDLMIADGYVGALTVGITNHITLGSWPLQHKSELRARVKAEAGRHSFSVLFIGTETFDDRVLYIAPKKSRALSALHARFDDGSDWVPHCSMYLSEEGGIAPAKTYLDSVFAPFKGWITRISLHEFFPAKYIEAVDLKGHVD